MFHKIYNRIADNVAGKTMRARISSIVLLETVAGVFPFSRNKRKEDKGLRKDETYRNDLLCRFVLDGVGKKIGESVAVDDDVVIIKTGSKYLGVPLAHIEDQGKTLLVKGLIEQDKAELLGEKWRRESFSDVSCKEEEKDGV